MDLLSVNELNGRSDIVGFKTIQCEYTNIVKTHVTKFFISAKGEFEIERYDVDQPYTGATVRLGRVDIDQLILFLQEAKVFISEEKMVRMLMGKR